MNPSVISEINVQLNASFTQMKKEKGPANDPVWSRVQNIALNCLGTGFCILECIDPIETKYRKIPETELQNLRNTFIANNSSLKEKTIKSIIEGIYSSPDEYWPHPYMVIDFNLPTSDKNIQSLSFVPIRKNLYNDAKNTDIPGGVLDIILPPNGGEETDSMVMLVKGNEEQQAVEGVKKYQKDMMEKIELYDSINSKILKAGLDSEGKSHLALGLADLWLIKAAILSPNNFLKEYVDYRFTNIIRSKPLAEADLRGIQELFNTIIDAAAGVLSETISATPPLVFAASEV